MYLKSITLRGFKSFPDRTRLEFGSGVSVVVGPNGSGKSNITDAVLWALGEQSPVAVRGQSMQDVIFGGAPGRQAGKTAEVELVLDDSDGVLGLGAPEISIVRRLDRTGEGEYRLAGARCRLVDVIELLSDTGLGKEMHSVISQGRVESLVTSKPRDRRLLIEEAAGLGKHRKRRRRAQLKLERTQDNLDRALDVEREARSRLRPLKRQAEAAELHARLERQALEARRELAREDLRVQLLELTGAQDDAALARARRERVETELHAVGERRQAAEEALAGRSAHREELSRRCFVAQSAGDRVSYRADAVRSMAARLDGRLHHDRELLAALEREVADEQPDPAAPERIAKLEATLAALDRDREAELARQLAGLEEQLRSADRLVAERSAAAEQAASARKEAEASSDRARAVLRETERAVEAARREAARVGGELAAVNQFLRGQAARPGGARVLGDELDVESGYELAIAAALDGRLRAAIVADRAAAGALLDSADADGGRALVSGSQRSPDWVGAGAGPPAPGAERLADHVQGSGEAVALARVLLHDTWLVDSLEHVPETFDGVAVTRAGRVWSARAREVRQPPAVGEERVLAERTRRAELVRASEAAAQAELAAAADLRRAGEAHNEADAACERAVAAHRAAIRERDEGAEQQRRIAAQIERRRAAPDDGPDAGGRAQAAAELSAERTAMQRVQRERAERAARIHRVRAAIVSGEALQPAVAGVVEALEATANAISGRYAEFKAALAADREEGEHVAAELKACAQQEAALHAQLHRENEALTETEVRLQRVRDTAEDVERELRQLAERLRLDAEPAAEPLPAEEREALTTRIERIARRREQLGPVNPLAQQEYAEAVEHVEELERQRADLETALRELEKLIANTDRQIRETFEQMFEAAARNFEQVVARLFPGGRGRLRLVAERDGPARVLGGQPQPESDDPDEPDAQEGGEAPTEEDLLGVEIEITPAGKEMKRLSLLSGGEKSMTALAFLFAVFLARPCPFYILDEVEAALDDLNIDRFLELLRVYSKQAQFIVVTHQKRTMEAADCLYGVSMGGDGISKVISRRLPPAEAAA
ncbi:MAG: AAA family ATPase [Solirubrobacterales bacterium]|nr:AAA family ATPase [Solirubrobacterales bacterium]